MTFGNTGNTLSFENPMTKIRNFTIWNVRIYFFSKIRSGSIVIIETINFFQEIYFWKQWLRLLSRKCMNDRSLLWDYDTNRVHFDNADNNNYSRDSKVTWFCFVVFNVSTADHNISENFTLCKKKKTFTCRAVSNIFIKFAKKHSFLWHWKVTT